MKILQVNVVYKNGSTGKIVYDIHTGLIKAGYQSIVCYGRKQQSSENGVYKFSSELEGKLGAIYTRISGLPYSAAFFATNKLLNIIKKEHPDIVHLHCLNGHIVHIAKLLTFLKNQKINTVLTLHAEFMYTGGCGHAYDCERWKSGCGHCPRLREATTSILLDRTSLVWQRMSEALTDFDNILVVSVSSWLNSRAKQSPFLKDKNLVVIENGIDTKSIFHPVHPDRLRSKYHLHDEQIILHVTARFSSKMKQNKGGWYVIELAKRLKMDNVKILVIGPRDIQGDMPQNIIFVGHTESQNELAAYYSMADLTVLTSKRETFSLVVAESLSCGTPVVGFKAGGPETICLTNYSDFVRYGDIDALEQCVRKWITKKASIHEQLYMAARERYSKEKMIASYIEAYSRLCNSCC